MPLCGLSFGGVWYFSQIKGWEPKQVAEHLFQNLYYNDPTWSALHNCLHSPTKPVNLAGIVFLVRPKFPWFAKWSIFFLTACLIHSVVDILTHLDDGLVMLFPFNWTYRFSSPISYWDRDHHGSAFIPRGGRLLHKFIVRPDLEKIFRFRQNTLSEIFAKMIAKRSESHAPVPETVFASLGSSTEPTRDFNS